MCQKELVKQWFLQIIHHLVNLETVARILRLYQPLSQADPEIFHHFK